jgi:hypothetical protein
MTKETFTREKLRFENFDQVIDRLELLKSSGYTQLGKWTLAQNCEHLRDWLVFLMDGYPKPKFPGNIVMAILRRTVGSGMLRKTLQTESMPDNTPTLKQTVHKGNQFDDASSVERLKDTLLRFKSFKGTYHPSPLFGQLDGPSGMKLQLVHCAHHLSFLKPNAPPSMNVE